ncbi:AraC family transcriptional regulator [Mesobacillus campisalis]|uniref:AraC family transcriptional regulator n=1 Tax=Mesobacillus campisalis TaxID=1408103 RepID=A0A0M2T1L7_9BACI|nr:AraC family transcriptional regulator [Mesobacillus campisalis]KKK39851.1 AraC family transcriptional regulator [Mesobacillus campisalis]
MSEQSIFMPVMNQFEIYDFSKHNETYILLEKHNESAQQLFSQFDSLFSLHSHDVMEILVFIDGECEFFCEGKTYTLKKGDVVIVPAYGVHKANVKDLHDYERIILTISPQLLADFSASSPSLHENILSQKTQASYVNHLDNKSFKDILSLLQEITDKIKKGEEHFTFTIHYLLFQVLQVIFNPTSSLSEYSHTEEPDQRLAAILEYIETHLTHPDLSLDTVSNEFHLNKYYFSHYFKKQMYLPFYRYVTLKRLSNAVTMIKQNELSIENIALKCGFTDYSSFYRLFKKEYNLSPKKMQTRDGSSASK